MFHSTGYVRATQKEPRRIICAAYTPQCLSFIFLKEIRNFQGLYLHRASDVNRLLNSLHGSCGSLLASSVLRSCAGLSVKAL